MNHHLTQLVSQILFERGELDRLGSYSATERNKGPKKPMADRLKKWSDKEEKKHFITNRLSSWKHETDKNRVDNQKLKSGLSSAGKKSEGERKLHTLKGPPPKKPSLVSRIRGMAKRVSAAKTASDKGSSKYGFAKNKQGTPHPTPGRNYDFAKNKTGTKPTPHHFVPSKGKKVNVHQRTNTPVRKIAKYVPDSHIGRDEGKKLLSKQSVRDKVKSSWDESTQIDEDGKGDYHKKSKKEKDAEWARGWAWNPELGDKIKKFGAKDRAERKAFASGKREINRLKRRNEETEQLDEIGDTKKGRDRLRRYSKSADTLATMNYMVGHKSMRDIGTLRRLKKNDKKRASLKKMMDLSFKLSDKYAIGKDRADQRLDKKTPWLSKKLGLGLSKKLGLEETEQLDEMGGWGDAENKIVKAFVNRKKAKNSHIHTHTDGDALYLHGSKIAWHGDDGEVKASMCGYGTPTTRSRLNCLAGHIGGGRFHQSKHTQHYNDKPIDSNERVTMRSGMSLKDKLKKGWNEETVDERCKTEDEISKKAEYHGSMTTAMKNIKPGKSKRHSQAYVAAVKQLKLKLEGDEQIDEVSKEKLRRYVSGALSNLRKQERDATTAFRKTGMDFLPDYAGPRLELGPKKQRDKVWKATSKGNYRETGILTAVNKLSGVSRVNVKEETEQLDEIGDTKKGQKMLGRYLKGASDSLDDLDKKKVKRVSGINNAVNRIMQKSGRKLTKKSDAYYEKEKENFSKVMDNAKKMKEETEQIDELTSKKMTSSTVKTPKKTYSDGNMHDVLRKFKSVSKKGKMMARGLGCGTAPWKEETEQVDEVSKGKARKYWNNASKHLHDLEYGDTDAMPEQKRKKKIRNRRSGMRSAEKKVYEETEQIDEGDVVSNRDFRIKQLQKNKKPVTGMTGKVVDFPKKEPGKEKIKRFRSTLPEADESYWTYKPGTRTPKTKDLPKGAFKGDQSEFEKLSPGMRREIERSAKKKGKH